MAGANAGVQALLRRMQTTPKAIYVHCLAHRLNLVLTDVCGSIDRVKTGFETVQLLYKFFSGSVVHNTLAAVITELQPGMSNIQLQSLSETRWYARHSAVKNHLKLMPSVHGALIDLSNDADATRRATSSGLLHTSPLQIILSSYDDVIVIFVHLRCFL